MPSQQEVLDLIANWKLEPSWDLEDTEGFEAHREQLLAASNQYKEECDREEQERLKKQSQKLNIPVELVGEYKRQIAFATRDKENAKRLLKYYFRSLIPDFNGDNSSEIESIVDFIVNGAVATLTAELIVANNQLPTEEDDHK